jgi:hypothetical protein
MEKPPKNESPDLKISCPRGYSNNAEANYEKIAAPVLTNSVGENYNKYKINNNKSMRTS